MLKKITLEPHQVKTLNKIRETLSKGHKRIGVQLITGGGKTIIAREIILKALQKGSRVLFIVKGNQLMKQLIGKSFNDIPFGVIWANKTRNLKANFIICSAPTYISSPEKYRRILERGDLFFVDEAHETTADKYTNMIDTIPKDKIVIGLTATFLRGVDGKGHKFWEKIITPITAKELAEAGKIPELDILFPEIDYSVDNVKVTGGEYNRKALYDEIKKSKVIYGNMIKLYKEHNPDKFPAIAFCINIQHCLDVAKEFEAIGVKALVIHSKLPKEEKKKFDREKDYLISAKIPFVICSVDMLSKGVDIPQLKIGFHLRPTKSKKLYFQQVGRLTRKEDRDPNKKERVLLIDMTPNYLTHGDPFAVFNPEQEDIIKERKKRQAGVKQLRVCKECGAKNEVFYSHCIVCNNPLVSKIEIKKSDATFRMATFDERNAKLSKAITQHNIIRKKTPDANLDKNWTYDKVYEKFGDEMFFKSDKIPEDQKRRIAKKKIEKMLKD